MWVWAMQHPLWEVLQVTLFDRLDLGLCTVPLFWLCALWARDHQVVLQMVHSTTFARTVLCWLLLLNSQ
jgi:hypothetical protein